MRPTRSVPRAIVILSVLTLLMGMMVTTASANHNPGAGASTTTLAVHPVRLPGNNNCPDATTEIRVQSPADGPFSANGFSVTIDVYTQGGSQYFDFTTAAGQVALDVYVKAGPDTNLYDYGAGASHDTALHGPINSTSPLRYYGLSHLSFCMDNAPIPDGYITIEDDDVNRVGDPHTFTVRTFFDADINVNPPSFAPADSAAVTVTFTGDVDDKVDTCANGTGDAGDSEAVGVCTVTFTSDTPGTVTAHAAATVNGIAVETDGAAPNSGDATKLFVDARISISPDGNNPIGAPHTFDVLVEANTGSGWNAIDVSGVTVTLAATAGATLINVDDDCANGTGGADDAGIGQCDVTFSSSTPGTVTGNASATVALTTGEGNINLPVSTQDVNSPTGEAVKTFFDGAIRILKDSTKGGSVSAFGTVFAVDGPDADTDADFNVTDGDGASGLDEDADMGEICVSGLTPGALYTITEVTPPTGYGAGSAGAGDNDAVAASGTCSTATFAAANTATFANPPLFDIQVNFRDGGSGETSIVSIDCDGDDDVDAAPATGWDDSLTVDDIEFVDESTTGEMTIECTLVVDP